MLIRSLIVGASFVILMQYILFMQQYPSLLQSFFRLKRQVGIFLVTFFLCLHLTNFTITFIITVLPVILVLYLAIYCAFLSSIHCLSSLLSIEGCANQALKIACSKSLSFGVCVRGGGQIPFFSARMGYTTKSKE